MRREAKSTVSAQPPAAELPGMAPGTCARLLPLQHFASMSSQVETGWKAIGHGLAPKLWWMYGYLECTNLANVSASVMPRTTLWCANLKHAISLCLHVRLAQVILPRHWWHWYLTRTTCQRPMPRCPQRIAAPLMKSTTQRYNSDWAI